MKKYLIKRVLTTHLLLFFVRMTYCQEMPPYENPAYGSDSSSRISCASDLSTMTEFIKINMYDYALPAWRNVFNNCPASSKNIYISGVRIFRRKIEESRDPEMKSAYYDTLMMNYDLRIKYFGEEGYVLGRKGIDIIRYNEKAYDKAYDAFLRSTAISGPETDPGYLLGLVQTGVVMMRSDKINEETFLTNFIHARDILAGEMTKEGNSVKFTQVSEAINKIVLNSGIQECSVIERVFSEHLAKEAEDPGLLQLTSQLLTSSGCTNSPFYASVNDKLLRLSPEAGRAYELARYYINQEKFDEATGYLDLAIKSEDNPEQKALFQYQQALILSSKLGRFAEAREQALGAIENRPGWGEPYFVIAGTYISGISECGGDDFDRKAVYWLAADYCNKAKKEDPSCAQKASELLSNYQSNFPSVEDSFFRSLKEGDPYRFNCWINESTTVKNK